MSCVRSFEPAIAGGNSFGDGILADAGLSSCRHIGAPHCWVLAQNGLAHVTYTAGCVCYTNQERACKGRLSSSSENTSSFCYISY